MRAIFCLAALLALAGSALATMGDNGMTTYDGRKRQPDTVVFGNQLVIDLMATSTIGFAADLLKGTFKPVPNEPAKEKKEIFVSCLNSVAPAPLNWKMWCPSDSKIMQWMDKSGALHRQVTIRPQAGMTSTMYMWWIISHLSGILPPVTEFQGNKYYYYHLWHPMDHVESAWSFGPKNPITQKGMPIYALIHERYRTPEGGNPSGKHYETNGWFFADDAIANLWKNRFVITMPLLGMPTLTMIIEFNDSHEGVIVDVEMIMGLPYKGFDERSPLRGYPTAAGLNEMAFAPAFQGKIPGAFDFQESLDAITRHVIEEFTNLQFFVPYFWEKYTVMGKAGINWMPTLGTWMQNNKIEVNDGRSISFYNALLAMSNKLVDKSNTTVGSAVDAAHAGALAAYQAKTDAASAAVVAKSQVYVQPSNAVTAANYQKNQGSGSHPEAVNTYGVFKGNDSMGVTVGHIGGNGTKPLAGLQEFLKSKFLPHADNNGTGDSAGKRVQFIKISHSAFQALKANHTGK